MRPMSARASATHPRRSASSRVDGRKEAHMRSAETRLLIAAAVLAGMPVPALAQPVNGFYVSGALGPTFQQNRSVTSPSGPQFAPAPVAVDPPSGSTATRGSIGVGLGNGLRFEAEGSGSGNRLRLPLGPP